MKTATINKIGNNREPMGDLFLQKEFNTNKEAIAWLYNDDNHPAIDCDGFVLILNDGIINTYIYGKNDTYDFTGYEYEI